MVMAPSPHLTAHAPQFTQYEGSTITRPDWSISSARIVQVFTQSPHMVQRSTSMTGNGRRISSARSGYFCRPAMTKRRLRVSVRMRVALPLAPTALFNVRWSSLICLEWFCKRLATACAPASAGLVRETSRVPAVVMLLTNWLRLYARFCSRTRSASSTSSPTDSPLHSSASAMALEKASSPVTVRQRSQTPSGRYTLRLGYSQRRSNHTSRGTAPTQGRSISFSFGMRPKARVQVI